MSRLLTLLLLSLITTAPLAGTLAIGDHAPDFRLQDQNGDWHALSDYRGKYLTIYFYPKDDTPGCTIEACNFRDNIYQFRRIGAEVVGVSLDSVASHQEFASKYKLPFILLADENAELTEAFGVLGQFGNRQIATRQTFIIDPKGHIVKHYAVVKPDEHTQQVLADLEQLMAEDTQAVGQR